MDEWRMQFAQPELDPINREFGKDSGHELFGERL
jgi:hypothetical protein